MRICANFGTYSSFFRFRHWQSHVESINSLHYPSSACLYISACTALILLQPVPQKELCRWSSFLGKAFNFVEECGERLIWFSFCLYLSLLLRLMQIVVAKWTIERSIFLCTFSDGGRDDLHRSYNHVTINLRKGRKNKKKNVRIC